MKKSNNMSIYTENLNDNENKIPEKNNFVFPTSIQYVVDEVSTLLNCNNNFKIKEQENLQFFNNNGFLSINASDIYKSSQLSSTIHLRSSDSLLLSLTALLSNPHHARYLDLMTDNVIEEFGVQSRKMNFFDDYNDKIYNPLTKSSRNKIVGLIASNLQYYLFEGKVTNVIINDLVVTLMKAFTNERNINFAVNDFSKWGANSQAFIEARDWSVLISPKECIFPKTCYELRELLIKQGIKLKSYFENIDSSESIVNLDSTNATVMGFNSQDTCNSTIDEIDARYLGKQTSFAKLRVYKSNNIPNYSQFENIKRHICANLPNIKSLFHSPGTCTYISGNDVITFLHILKKVVEDGSQGSNNPEQEMVLKVKSLQVKDPYWFMKEIKRIVTNFPVRDTTFKASACDCNYIHSSTQNKTKGFYELKIEGLFLPNSLFVIMNGLKLLCSDLYTCNISIENIADPPFIPLELTKPNVIWEKITPILSTVIRSISPKVVERAMIWKPFKRVFFDDLENAGTKIMTLPADQSQLQAVNSTLPAFSLPRKRLSSALQLNNSQRSFPLNINCKSIGNLQNVSTTSNFVLDNTSINQGQLRNISITNTNISNIIDFSISNGILDNLSIPAATIFTPGVNNPQITRSSSSIDNQQSFVIPQHSNLQYSPLLPSAGIRARTQNSLSTHMQCLNFKNIGFSSTSNSNYVSLATPMGKQLLHRTGIISPIQRLEQIQNATQNQIKLVNKNLVSNLCHRSSTENFISFNPLKIFDETAFCFLGFDSERLEYFTARAIEEGAKVVTLEDIKKEYSDYQPKLFDPNNVKISQFVYSWLKVTRFYCIINDFSLILTNHNDSIFKEDLKTAFSFEIQQLVSLEWFLTTCFEKRPLDPDMFTPISRPFIIRDIPIMNENTVESDIIIVILDNFPHITKICNSFKNGQLIQNHAVWINCMQRILKTIYGPYVINIRDITSLIEKEGSKWKTNPLNCVAVVPCNTLPYKSSDIFVKGLNESIKIPVSTLHGSSKFQFINDMEYLKKKFGNLGLSFDPKKMDEFIRVVSPSWLLESCFKRQKIDYSQYELKYSNSLVLVQKRKKSKYLSNLKVNNSISKEEEVCLFYRKNDSKNKNLNLIPSYGPWPLWGWMVCIITSKKAKFSESIYRKLGDIGATFFNFSANLEDLLIYSYEKLNNFFEKMKQEKVNLILCNDIFDSKFRHKLIDLKDFSKTKNGFLNLQNLNIEIVGESWINMVHGTRTLHPFDSKFYFSDPKTEKHISANEQDKIIAVPDKIYLSQRNITLLNNIENEENVNIEKANGSSKEILENESFKTEQKRLESKNLIDSTLVADLRRTPFSESFVEENGNNKDFNLKYKKSNHLSEFPLAERNAIDSSESDVELTLIKQKRRKLSRKTNFSSHTCTEVASKTVFIDRNNEMSECNVNKNTQIEDSNEKNMVKSQEFLVPFSFSFLSGWVDDQGKEFMPMLISSHTPVRRKPEFKGTQFDDRIFQTSSNWFSQKYGTEGCFSLNFCPIQEFKADIESQTDVVTVCNIKCQDEYENDYLGNTTATDNVSPILCPIIPTNTLTF